MQTVSLGDSKPFAWKLLGSGSALGVFVFLRWHLFGQLMLVGAALVPVLIGLGVRYLLRSGPRLFISSAGLRYLSWGPQLISWSEIQGLHVWPDPSRQAIDVVVLDPRTFRRRLAPLPRAISYVAQFTRQPAFGIYAAEFAMTPEALLDLLQRARRASLEPTA